MAAEKALGNQGVIILSFIALFATSNTALMMLISASRIIYGMARDTKDVINGSSGSNTNDATTNIAINTSSDTNLSRNAFPLVLSKIHSLRKTPWVAIIIAMFCAMLTVGLFSGDISGAAKYLCFWHIFSLCIC